MQKTSVLAAFAVIMAVLLTPSCTKVGVRKYEGYYSFKTGGYVDLKGKVYDIQIDTVGSDTTYREITIGGRTFRDTVVTYRTVNDTIASRDTSFIRHLNAESGQMHILRDGDSKAVVTMNVTGGSPYVFDASVEGDNLVLLASRRKINFANETGEKNSMYEVSGKARRLDDMVIFDLDIRGEYKMTGVDATVASSSVNCIASVNR